MEQYYIGVDIGGTFIKAGVCNGQGKILAKSAIPTGKERPYLEIAEDMAKQIYALCEEAKIPLSSVVGVGAGSPGNIDSATGTVIYSPNIRWDNVPIGACLSELIGKPVRLTNDANAAALGEARFGAGKKYSDSLFITLGTGVGGGIVIGGKLFEGFRSAGAEVGHTVIHVGGEPCACGRSGCFEAYASATALIRETKKAMERAPQSLMWKYAPTSDEVTGKTAFDAAQAGDLAAQAVIDSYILHLGEGIVNLINILRPEVVILGGGVCAQGDALLVPLRKHVEKYSYGGMQHAPVLVEIASLGNDAGLLGAAALLM